MAQQRPTSTPASEQLSLWDANVIWYTDDQEPNSDLGLSGSARRAELEGAAPVVSALRQLVLRYAVEHEAARWASTPGVGRSGAARYIWETLQNQADANPAARDMEYQWIEAYLRDHPEVFDLPATRSTLDERRRELSDQADKRALLAYRAGDIDGAVQALAEAQALHPNPGRHFADAIAAVRAAAATSVPQGNPDRVVGADDGGDSGSAPELAEASMAANGLSASEETSRRVSVAHPRPASPVHSAPHAADVPRSRAEHLGRQRTGVAPDVA